MDQRILANSPIIQDFHYGPFGCADYSDQNFHFGAQAASSVHLIASFAAVQSKLISLSWSFSTYRTPPSRHSARFFPRILICAPPSSTQPVPPAHRAAAPCRQTAASSDGSPPGGGTGRCLFASSPTAAIAGFRCTARASANRTGRASPIARPFSPAVAANSSATSSRSSSAAPAAAIGCLGCRRSR